jgi:hypothetical protein
MRIQETNGILKEARYARNAANHTHENEGMVARTWKMISDAVTGLFKR